MAVMECEQQYVSRTNCLLFQRLMLFLLLKVACDGEETSNN